MNLPNALISSFASLTNRFTEQFVSNKNLEKIADDYYQVIQKKRASLHIYVGCYNKQKVFIPSCVTSTAISAFKRGLLPGGDMYRELLKYQWWTMEDVLSRAWTQIKWEKDTAYLHRHSLLSYSLVIKHEKIARDERPYQRSRSKNTGRRSDQRQHGQTPLTFQSLMQSWLVC